MIKRLISVAVATLLFSISLTSIYAAELPEEVKHHKLLSLAYIMTFTNPGGDQHFAIINGEQIKVNVDGGTTATITGGTTTFPKSKEEVKVVDIEEYNGSNFTFGTDLVTQQIVGEVETDYFYSYPLIMIDADSFKKNYLQFTPLTAEYKSKNPKENTIQANYNVQLNGNYMDYMKHLKEGRGVDYIYEWFGGVEKANSSVKTVLERFRNMNPSEIAKYEGRLYFVPHIIIAEAQNNLPDIIVSNGKATIIGSKIKYEYTVSLTNQEKLENVIITDTNKLETINIPLLEKNKPQIITNEIDPGTAEYIDINIHANKEETIKETIYTNNVYIDKVQLNDLEVVDLDINNSAYPPSTSVAIPVIVRNNSNKELNSVLNVNGFDKNVNFAPGEQKVVNMAVTTPKTGSINVVAEINKSKSIKEYNYTNNIKSKPLKVFNDEDKPATGCPSVVNWTEREGKEEKRVDKYTDADGKTHKEIYYVTVWYNFSYQATMKTSVNITDDKDKQKNNVITKAGYGIKVDSNTTIDIIQTGGDWKRSPKEANKKMPTKATATTSWTVKKIHNQPKTVSLTGSNGVFTTPVNSSSKNKAKVIYTDLDMADGTHKITTYISGASVNGQPMCNTVVSSIKIKGDMYEDYSIN